MFALGLQLADAEDEQAQGPFRAAFDAAMELYGVAWTLSFGLDWCRPWSFLSPELSLEAWTTTSSTTTSVDDSDEEASPAEEPLPPPLPPYGVSDIVAEGCFQPPERLEAILQRWHDKKT